MVKKITTDFEDSRLKEGLDSPFGRELNPVSESRCQGRPVEEGANILVKSVNFEIRIDYLKTTRKITVQRLLINTLYILKILVKIVLWVL